MLDASIYWWLKLNDSLSGYCFVDFDNSESCILAAEAVRCKVVTATDVQFSGHVICNYNNAAHDDGKLSNILVTENLKYIYQVNRHLSSYQRGIIKSILYQTVMKYRIHMTTMQRRAILM